MNLNNFDRLPQGYPTSPQFPWDRFNNIQTPPPIDWDRFKTLQTPPPIDWDRFKNIQDYRPYQPPRTSYCEF